MKANAEEKSKMGLALKLFLWTNILNSFALILAYLCTHISPNSFAYFSYFGLAYPIWLGIALLFIVFWFFSMRVSIHLNGSFWERLVDNTHHYTRMQDIAVHGIVSISVVIMCMKLF